MRKTFKKLLAMALAATMVVGLAACGGDEGTNNNATPTPATSGDSANAGNSGNAGTAEKKDLDKLTIMVDGTVQFANPAHGGAQFEAELEKLMGIDVEIIMPDHSSYYSTVSQTFANPDKSYWPDIVLMGSTYYVQYAQNGILVDVTDMWNNSEIKASGRVTNPQIFEDSMIDGRLYGIAPARGNGCVTYVKKTWLERAGYTMNDLPKTYAEYTEMLDAFKDLSPEGYALTSSGLVNLEAPYTNYLPEFFWNAYPDFYQTESGEWVDGFTQPEMYDALERLAEGVANGWIDPEFSTNQTSDCRNKFYADKCGVFTYWAGTWASNLEENLALIGSPSELVALEPIAELGNYIERYAPMWVITSACENPEQAFDLFFGTMLDGAEGQSLWTYGVEDVHWSTKAETITTGTGRKAKSITYADGEFHFRADLETGVSLYNKNHIDPMLAVVAMEEGKDVGVNAIEESATESANLFYANSVSAPKMVSNDAMYKYYSTVMAARIMLVELVASGEYSIEDAFARYEDEQGANVKAILDALNK